MAVSKINGIGNPIAGWPKDELPVFKKAFGIVVQQSHATLAKPEEHHHGQHGHRDNCKGQAGFSRMNQGTDSITKRVREAKKSTDDNRGADEVGQQKPAVFHP